MPQDENKDKKWMLYVFIACTIGIILIVLAFVLDNSDDDQSGGDGGSDNSSGNDDDTTGEVKNPDQLSCDVTKTNTQEFENSILQPAFFRQGTTDDEATTMLVMSNAENDAREYHQPITLDVNSGVTLGATYTPPNFSVRVEDSDKYYMELEVSYNRVQLVKVPRASEGDAESREVVGSMSLQLDDETKFMMYHMECVGLRKIATNSWIIHLAASWLQNKQCTTLDDASQSDNSKKHRLVYIQTPQLDIFNIEKVIQLEDDIQEKVHSIMINNVMVNVYLNKEGYIQIVNDDAQSLQDSTSDTTWKTISSLLQITNSEKCVIYALDEENDLYKLTLDIGDGTKRKDLTQTQVTYYRDSTSIKDLGFTDSVRLALVGTSSIVVYDQQQWCVYSKIYNPNSDGIEMMQIIDSQAMNNTDLYDVEGMMNSGSTNDIDLSVVGLTVGESTTQAEVFKVQCNDNAS